MLSAVYVTRISWLPADQTVDKSRLRSHCFVAATTHLYDIRYFWLSNAHYDRIVSSNLLITQKTSKYMFYPPKNNLANSKHHISSRRNSDQLTTTQLIKRSLSRGCAVTASWLLRYTILPSDERTLRSYSQRTATATKLCCCRWTWSEKIMHRVSSSITTALALHNRTVVVWRTHTSNCYAAQARVWSTGYTASS